ncbi:MAG: hypothetical protein EBQ89_07420 [Alphaproteobacteria bacterium]|nr:hypothetical protein [Alphaproteobacteria bacterium]
MSCIYKIYPVDNPTIYYVGSTKDKLSVRLAEHKYRYKVWKMIINEANILFSSSLMTMDLKIVELRNSRRLKGKNMIY